MPQADRGSDAVKATSVPAWRKTGSAVDSSGKPLNVTVRGGSVVILDVNGGSKSLVSGQPRVIACHGMLVLDQAARGNFWVNRRLRSGLTAVV